MLTKFRVWCLTEKKRTFEVTPMEYMKYQEFTKTYFEKYLMNDPSCVFLKLF